MITIALSPVHGGYFLFCCAQVPDGPSWKKCLLLEHQVRPPLSLSLYHPLLPILLLSSSFFSLFHPLLPLSISTLHLSSLPLSLLSFLCTVNHWGSCLICVCNTMVQGWHPTLLKWGNQWGESSCKAASGGISQVQIEKPIRNKNELNRPNLVQKVQIEKHITRPNQPDLASIVDHLDQYWLKKGMCK